MIHYYDHFESCESSDSYTWAQGGTTLCSGSSNEPPDFKKRKEKRIIYI